MGCSQETTAEVSPVEPRLGLKSPAQRASCSCLTRYHSLIPALPGAWWALQFHTLLTTEEFLLWGLVLSMSPGSKQRTTQQVDFKLRRCWIIVDISLKLSVIMTLEAFDCSIDQWISLIQKRSVLSCSVLYKFFVSFYYILFILLSLICARIELGWECF